MDNFREEIVIRKNKGLFEVLYVLSVVLMIAFGAVALFAFNLFFQVLTSGAELSSMVIVMGTLIISALAAFGLFMGRKYLRMEYEYTFTNGEMDFARVIDNSKRTQYPSFNLRSAEYVGRVGDSRYEQFAAAAEEKYYMILNKDTEKYYIYIALEKGSKTLIVFEPSQVMVDMMKQHSPQKVNV